MQSVFYGEGVVRLFRHETRPEEILEQYTFHVGGVAGNALRRDRPVYASCGLHSSPGRYIY